MPVLLSILFPIFIFKLYACRKCGVIIQIQDYRLFCLINKEKSFSSRNRLTSCQIEITKLIVPSLSIAQITVVLASVSTSPITKDTSPVTIWSLNLFQTWVLSIAKFLVGGGATSNSSISSESSNASFEDCNASKSVNICAFPNYFRIFGVELPNDLPNEKKLGKAIGNKVSNKNPCNLTSISNLIIISIYINIPIIPISFYKRKKSSSINSKRDC